MEDLNHGRMIVKVVVGGSKVVVDVEKGEEDLMHLLGIVLAKRKVEEDQKKLNHNDDQ